jgi:hypothetical protein
MKDNVIKINSFKEKKAQEIIEFILKADDYQTIEFLARAYVEYVKMGKQELGDQLVTHGVNMKMEYILKLVYKRIDQLRSNDESSSD